jgi:F0F1-type ATP synthase membrane subunit b/b'
MLETVVSILDAVSLNPTDGIMILVCTVLLTILYKLLAVKVFNPLLEHVEQRESLTSGAVHTAGQMRQKTAALKARFDEAIFKARVEGNTKRSEIVAAAKEKAQAIVQCAEEEASVELAAGRQEIARKLASAKSVADAEADLIATQLVAQVDNHLAG